MEYVQLIDSIWKRSVDFTSIVSAAEALSEQGGGSLSAAVYALWIERNNSPFKSYAYFNLGVIVFGQGDYEGAKKYYENAIQLNPELWSAYVNLGLTLEKLGDSKAACDQWLKLEELINIEDGSNKEILISSLNNIGRVQEVERNFQMAEDYYKKSLLLKAKQTEVLHHLIFVRARKCDWPVYDSIPGVDMEYMKKSTSALALIALTDDPERHLEVIGDHAKEKAPLQKKSLSKQARYNHEKIRIGYCSSDFCMHAVSMLTVELLELHNKDEFEIYGFCWSRNDGSELRRRVVQSFDHYFPIGNLNDEEAAKLIRSCEIDVLIDLQGQTSGARMKMLAWRPAPIQITYLGLPATTGIPAIDYIVADDFLIPEGSEKFYSEKVIRMPDVYQVSDRKRVIAEKPSREKYNLPEDKFVFCSFNNNYKYTEEVFSAWMRILDKVPDSVLWLLADNDWSKTNLINFVEKSGIALDRIIFAERVMPSEYLARYQLADLFLDTFPFNGGTTANDVLWMGLPLLTLSGRSFGARMAGALLTAAGVDELIAYSIPEYESKAVELAINKKYLKKIKNKIEKSKESSNLFNMERFAENFEKKIKELVWELPEVQEHGLTVQKIIEIGEGKTKNGDLAGAESAYLNWLRLDSSKAGAWVVKFNLGVILHNTGRHRQAKSYFQEALDENPNLEQCRDILSREEYGDFVVSEITVA